MRHQLFAFLAFAAWGLTPVHAAPPGLQKVLGLAETAASADQAPAGTAADNRPEDLDARRQDVAQRILVAQRTLDAAKGTTTPESKPAERLSREVDLLKQLDVLYAQLQSAQESLKQLEAGKIELEQKLSDLRRDGPAEKRPYSFLLVDSLRDTLSTEESRVGTIAAAIEAATDALGREKATCDEQQANRRRIKEAAEKNSDQSKTAELATELRLAELEADVAQQSVALRHAELANEKSAQQLQRVHLSLLQESLACMEKVTLFSESDLQDQLVDIEKQEADLKQELQASELTLEYAGGQWSGTRQPHGATQQITPALREDEKTARLAHFCQTQRIGLVQKQLERLGSLRQAWRRRFAVATNNAERGELLAWKKEAGRVLEQLDLERRLQELLIGEKRKELADLDARLEAAKDDDPELAHSIEKEQVLYEQLIETYSANLVKLETHRNLHEKLLSELREKTDQTSLSDWLAAGREAAVIFWNYELTNVKDNPVTVGKVGGGVALVIFGVFLSRHLARILARRILPHVGIHDGAAAAVQSLTFYALVLTSVLMALHMVNVPLTVFTFMGGAAAIGVGFGSQNILNNFISGVILLVERPVRVGDLIEVGSLSGTVESIGTRSTRIRTGSNSEIIVPNSLFLESNVVNWTLSDSTVKCSVRVGLAYGSPTREVARWLTRAAEEHGLVLKKPEPFVWFSDFGDNALVFELHFWIGIRTLSDRRRIESDLRFMIDNYFREAGIRIAFPQRDMHLDVLKPLEVCVRPHPLEASLTSNNQAA